MAETKKRGHQWGSYESKFLAYEYKRVCQRCGFVEAGDTAGHRFGLDENFRRIATTVSQLNECPEGLRISFRADRELSSQIFSRTRSGPISPHRIAKTDLEEYYLLLRSVLYQMSFSKAELALLWNDPLSQGHFEGREQHMWLTDLTRFSQAGPTGRALAKKLEAMSAVQWKALGDALWRLNCLRATGEIDPEEAWRTIGVRCED